MGGEDASVGAWPHMGSLQYGGMHVHLCGCSLIGVNKVLTAAHCIVGDV